MNRGVSATIVRHLLLDGECTYSHVTQDPQMDIAYRRSYFQYPINFHDTGWWKVLQFGGTLE